MSNQDPRIYVREVDAWTVCCGTWAGSSETHPSEHFEAYRVPISMLESCCPLDMWHVPAAANVRMTLKNIRRVEVISRSTYIIIPQIY